jgi:ABC-type Zn uptake system ZnuABC Zn-binding protein ZnuA
MRPAQRITLPLLLLSGAALAGPGARLQVLTTIPDLRDLAAAVGGERVEATSLLQGPEDPHFVDPKPAFLTRANQADVFILCGMDLEIGYAGRIVADSRNPRIQPGAPGYCDASVQAQKIGLPAAGSDRSQGDLHAQGNPHYLLDPVNAKRAAATIRDRLKLVDSGSAAAYDQGLEAFQRRVDEAMFGPKLLGPFRAADLEELLARGLLLEFLKKRKLDGDLGGWAAELAPFAGAPFVDYHPGGMRYLARRFHLEPVGAVEEKPGVPPSPAQLARVIRLIKERHVKALVWSRYNPKANVDRIVEGSGAAAVLLAHQVGAVESARDYVSMMTANVTALRSALGRP